MIAAEQFAPPDAPSGSHSLALHLGPLNSAVRRHWAKLMRFVNILFILLIGILFSCNWDTRREITLSSGKKFKITAIVRFESADGPIMAIHYDSKTATTKNAALMSETVEVWDGYFRAEVEKAHYKNAMIIGMCLPKGDGFIQDKSGYPYYFKQSPDGTWSMTK